MVTKEQVIEALKECRDPELGLDVWTLGLIYHIGVNRDVVYIHMTFTAPFCPYGSSLVEMVREKVKAIKGVRDVEIAVVFDPPWKPSEEVRLLLGLP